jgi:hypothetical protein
MSRRRRHHHHHFRVAQSCTAFHAIISNKLESTQKNKRKKQKLGCQKKALREPLCVANPGASIRSPLPAPGAAFWPAMLVHHVAAKVVFPAVKVWAAVDRAVVLWLGHTQLLIMFGSEMFGKISQVGESPRAVCTCLRAFLHTNGSRRGS